MCTLCTTTTSRRWGWSYDGPKECREVGPPLAEPPLGTCADVVTTTTLPTCEVQTGCEDDVHDQAWIRAPH